MLAHNAMVSYRCRSTRQENVGFKSVTFSCVLAHRDAQIRARARRKAAGSAEDPHIPSHWTRLRS